MCVGVGEGVVGGGDQAISRRRREPPISHGVWWLIWGSSSDYVHEHACVDKRPYLQNIFG